MTPYYEQDGITIYHGDCRDILPSLIADVMVTDPPYGVGLGERRATGLCARDHYLSFDDTEHHVVNVVVPAVVMALGVVKRAAVMPGTRCLMAYPWPHDVGAIFYPAATGASRWGFCSSQPILFYGSDPKGRRKEPNSLAWSRFAEKTGHPCPKPLGVMKWLVARVSHPFEVVVDPFMGSGTTLVAAKQMGHPAIGIEIEEAYCEMAATRLRQRAIPFEGVG